VSKLAGARHELGNTMDAAMWGGEVSDAEIRRWVATVGRTRTDSFIALTIALWRARLETTPSAAVNERLEHFAKRASTIAYRDPIELADLAVDGEDLGRVGIAPGPKLGKVLHALLEIVITDPAKNNREALLEAARAL
jgi:tRNA nucleotidyltransferase (CCA-adding enzyme)